MLLPSRRNTNFYKINVLQKNIQNHQFGDAETTTNPAKINEKSMLKKEHEKMRETDCPEPQDHQMARGVTMDFLGVCVPLHVLGFGLPVGHILYK